MVPTSIATDTLLRQRMEDASLEPDRFGHEEHVRLGYCYLAEHEDFAVAAASFRRTLRRYADAVGATGKYHETLTWAWLSLIREAMDASPNTHDSRDLIAQHPELLDRHILSTIYDDVPALIANPIARRIFVMPKLRRLNVSAVA